MSEGSPDTAALELAEQTRTVNERLLIAGLRMQELAEEAEAARRRLAVLADAGRLLGTSFDLAGVLPSIGRLLVRELYDGCSIDVSRESGAPLCSVTEPEAVARQAAPAIERARGLALERRRALICASAPDGPPDDSELAELVRAAGFASVVSLPIGSRTSARGALTLLVRSRAPDPEDVTLVEQLTERIGLALDRAELHQETLDAVRARDDLLAAVSHDLRNPLHTITLSSDLLAASNAVRADMSFALVRIQQATAHMQRLLQDLVDSAQIGAGRFVLDRRPQPPATVVAEVIKLLAPLAESKSMRLEAEIDGALDEVVAWLDGDRILRMLTNLVGNAIKFTPKGGSVTVRAERVDDEVRLSVRDTGPGVPPEDLARLFDRFWQARQTARLGTGLGLFIAKEIVVAHGGRIWVESELGAGSTFFVALPLGAPPAADP